MNVETTELKAVEETVQAAEASEILTLSLQDLDLVAGGAHIGNFL